MSKHASPTVIGAFVLSALVLLVAGILIVGGGRLFHDTAHVRVYFDGSVAGLRIGAPVKFRGIDIGKVKDVRISMTGAIRDPNNIRIPVLLEIDEDRLTAEGVAGIDFDDREQVDRLVGLGLRAMLETESVVTGVRFVALDVKPATPAYVVGDRTYPEIPSMRGVREQIPDKLNQILTKLANTNFPGLVDSVQATVDEAGRVLAKADSVIGSPDLARAVASLDELTATLRDSVTDVSKDLTPTIKELKEAVTTARKTVTSAGVLSTQFDATLRDVQIAARSLRRLTDQISRDPGAVVRGGNP